jgi:hypothetical protein
MHQEVFSCAHVLYNPPWLGEVTRVAINAAIHIMRLIIPASNLKHISKHCFSGLGDFLFCGHL